MEVVHIPKGSVHIEVKELAMSKNYIGKWQPENVQVTSIVSVIHISLLMLMVRMNPLMSDQAP